MKNAAEPEATSSTKSTKKSTVTVDEASGVTTVEEIEEINDDDSSSGRSVEDIQAELEKDAEEEEVKKYKPSLDQVEEISALVQGETISLGIWRVLNLLRRRR